MSKTFHIILYYIAQLIQTQILRRPVIRSRYWLITKNDLCLFNAQTDIKSTFYYVEQESQLKRQKPGYSVFVRALFCCRPGSELSD